MTSVGTASRTSTATSTTSAPQTNPNDHVVQPGESLWDISQEHRVPLKNLLAANPQIKNPNVISPGQVVHIPQASTTAVSTPAPAAESTTPRPVSTAARAAPPPAAPPQTLSAPQADLQRGSRGGEVRKLQSALVHLGHMSQTDMNTAPGVFGPATEKSLKAFQQSKGLVADGKYGSKSRAALEAALRPSTPTTPETPSTPEMPTTPETPSPTTPTSHAPPAPQSTLRRGSTGEDVRKLQTALVHLGHMSQATMDSGPTTFGPGCEAALKRFQAASHISADGVYGPQSRAALEKALAQHPNPVEPHEPTQLEKPPVISKPSPNCNSRRGHDIDAIIIHHTASNNAAGDLATMRDPNPSDGNGPRSAHYLIAPDGTIYQLVDDQKRAWHAGKSGMPGQPESDVNATSLGIEITNDGKGTPFTEAQYRALEKLVPYLAQKYDVPFGNVLGHRDVCRPRNRKPDPADYFDWSRVRNALTNAGID